MPSIVHLLNRFPLLFVFFFFQIFCCNFHASSQTYGDKNFYLVDSINLLKLESEDKLLLDTTLTLYFKAEHDTIKLALIEHIVDQCWDDEVWPKYNSLLHDLALHHLTIATNKSESNRYASFLAGTISNMGFISDNQGNVPTALQQYHQSLKIYEKIRDKKGQSTSLNNLGVLYSSQDDTAKARLYHSQSLDLKKMLDDKTGLAMSLNNMGNIYENRGFPFEALDYFQQSLAISREMNDERGIAISYDNIAGIYFQQGYPTKAIEFYNKSIEIWENFGEESGLAYSHNNMAEVYLSMGNLREALIHSQKSLLLAKRIGYPMDIQNASLTLSQIKKAEKNYKDALEYFELYVVMKDSVFNENTERAAMAQSVKYTYEKEALKDSLENLKLNEIKDIQINERDAIIDKEKTFKYALMVGLLLMGGLVFVSIRGYQRKKKDNELIQLQKQEVETQKIKIEKQHHILEETHKEISDSITYAYRIQQAILPPRENLKKYLNDGFVWFKPKNVVSGDFYWMESFAEVSDSEGKNLVSKDSEGETILIAVADCTGHGVPGAMVSVVCHNALNRSVFEFGLTRPDLILNKTRELVIETFDKSGDDVKDGMDISLCSINQKKKKLIYAGANNNLYIIRNNELSEIKADKQPIGRFSDAKPFNYHEFNLQDSDCIYLFSDGLADQFGGPKGKKFKYQQFKDLLIQHHQKPSENQKELLESVFETWRGELEQVDDICIIGVRI